MGGVRQSSYLARFDAADDRRLGSFPQHFTFATQNYQPNVWANLDNALATDALPLASLAGRFGGQVDVLDRRRRDG